MRVPLKRLPVRFTPCSRRGEAVQVVAGGAPQGRRDVDCELIARNCELRQGIGKVPERRGHLDPICARSHTSQMVPLTRTSSRVRPSIDCWVLTNTRPFRVSASFPFEPEALGFFRVRPAVDLLVHFMEGVYKLGGRVPQEGLVYLLFKHEELLFSHRTGLALES